MASQEPPLSQEDEEFLARLKEITGDAAVWDDFDAAAWRNNLSDGEDPDLLEFLGFTDVEYDSDDSAHMILNAHKLTPAEKAAQGVEGKLNKARQYASTETAWPNELARLENIEWEETGISLGDPSAEGDRFVAWMLVEAYPEMFVGKSNGARAAPLFTHDALTEDRVWDLYYVHCPPDLNMKPVVMVPTYQFQHLLAIVNAKLETQFTVPPGKNKERYMMSFGLGNSPRPRFLGRCNSLASFKEISEAIPAPHPEDDLSKATTAGLDEFKQLLQKSRTDRKRVRKSDKNRAKRFHAHKAWGRSVKRAQRYLGLRGRTNGQTAGEVSPSDLGLLMADGPESSVLFVCIDIEAWEKNQNVVTEVGIATLDTTEIRDIAPGQDGQNWFPHIHARHIRVDENKWAENKRFVRGCADHFNFGNSEFIAQSLITPIIKDLIDNATFVDPVDGATTKPRPVVLVFHESSADVKFLRLLSYHAEDAQNAVDVLDTREMHQFLVRSNDSASLATVLAYLGIAHSHLHNAGNDAVYTLQAMVGLAVRKRVMSLEKATGDVADYDLNKENEGWTSGEDTDGGDPVRLPDTREAAGTADAGDNGWD